MPFFTLNFIKSTLIVPGFLFLLMLLSAGTARAIDTTFYFGADLSYVNQMEDCGAEYLYRGEPRDPFQIFQEQGTNLVRARLWVDPSWWQEPLEQPEGVKPWYNDLEDVMKTFRRAKDEGMDIMLGFHYSDIWADPGRQLIPRAWQDVAYDVEALRDSVYNYTRDVLETLEEEGLMPDFVKVGNETNSGMLRQLPSAYGPSPWQFEPDETVASHDDFERHAQLFNAGIQAIREVGETASVDPKISLHWSNLSGVNWWYGQMIGHGVTDFDIVGFTYYYAWHEGSIGQLESTVENLVSNYPDYEVMVVETGYLWSQDYGGIINTPDPEYLPVIPEKQLEYMVDYTRAVMRAGGTGVIFWEPAWVDTPCATPWGTGSSHTHVSFFHPDDLNFMENGGGRWTNPEFYEDPEWPKVTFRVNMADHEVADDGLFITGSFSGDNDDWELIPMADEGGGVYSWFTYLPEGDTGAYYFVNGEDWDARETVPEECADWWDTDRGYEVPDEDVTFGFEWGSCTWSDPEEVEVTFMVDMADSGVDFDDGVYITGTFSGNGDWNILSMEHVTAEIYSHTTTMMSGDEGAYYYLTTGSWTNYQDFRETVPEECAEWWDSDRGYVVPDEDVTFAYKWGTCETFEVPTSALEPDEIPDNYGLRQNYPNPFNPVTQITYEVAETAHVTLRVYDMIGREVKTLVDGRHSPGVYHATFDGTRFSSGIYLYMLQAGSETFTRTMTLMK